MDYCPPGSSVHEFSRKEYWEWDAIPFSRGSCWWGIKPGPPALQAESFPSESPGKQMYRTSQCLLLDSSSHFFPCSKSSNEITMKILQTGWSLTKILPLWPNTCLSFKGQFPNQPSSTNPLLIPPPTMILSVFELLLLWERHRYLWESNKIHGLSHIHTYPHTPFIYNCWRLINNLTLTRIHRLRTPVLYISGSSNSSSTYSSLKDNLESGKGGIFIYHSDFWGMLLEWMNSGQDIKYLAIHRGVQA